LEFDFFRRLAESTAIAVDGVIVLEGDLFFWNYGGGSTYMPT
jgi:hypothetical protein